MATKSSFGDLLPILSVDFVHALSPFFRSSSYCGFVLSSWAFQFRHGVYVGSSGLSYRI